MRVENPNATIVREKLREMSERIGDEVGLTDRETKTGSRETTLKHETGRFEITLVESDDEDTWYINIDHEEEHGVDTYTDVESLSYTISEDNAIPHKLVVGMEEWNL